MNTRKAVDDPIEDGWRVAQQIRPSNSLSVLGIPSCRCLHMIPAGHSLPKCSPWSDRSEKANSYSFAGKVDGVAGVELPRVYVSYSWTSEDHIQTTVELCERLCANGVDVLLDQWDLREEHDKYEFMEQMVSDESIKRVLIICDSGYKAKADGRKGGVGTESPGCFGCRDPEVWRQNESDRIPVSLPINVTR